MDLEIWNSWIRDYLPFGRESVSWPISTINSLLSRPIPRSSTVIQPLFLDISRTTLQVGGFGIIWGSFFFLWTAFHSVIQIHVTDRLCWLEALLKSLLGWLDKACKNDFTNPFSLSLSHIIRRTQSHSYTNHGTAAGKHKFGSNHVSWIFSTRGHPPQKNTSTFPTSLSLALSPWLASCRWKSVQISAAFASPRERHIYFKRKSKLRAFSWSAKERGGMKSVHFLAPMVFFLLVPQLFSLLVFLLRFLRVLLRGICAQLFLLGVAGAGKAVFISVFLSRVLGGLRFLLWFAAG